ncbi:uncharacterized protein LOC141616751 [Silene latifolia]|uniref:uncharacterized protein LOC141616751 n=1 Tax=Silene latifolia TaxID=37657 RepID=UPI003D77EBD8
MGDLLAICHLLGSIHGLGVFGDGSFNGNWLFHGLAGDLIGIPGHCSIKVIVFSRDATRRHTKADKRISCREYYAYKYQIGLGNFLLRGGRLFQIFIVDMYVKIENTRLEFFRLNQDAIRADLYQGILDTLELGENSASNVGKRMILPPSFLGGPRDMRGMYLNAMALVQKYGKPDLFLTMACNTNWSEIKSELAPGELEHNRPYLVARIFNAKLTALRKEIMEKKVFGEVSCHNTCCRVPKARPASCTFSDYSQNSL